MPETGAQTDNFRSLLLFNNSGPVLERGTQDNGGSRAFDAFDLSELLQNLVQAQGGLRIDDDDQVEGAADRIARPGLDGFADLADDFRCVFRIHCETDDRLQPVFFRMLAQTDRVAGL